MNTVLISALAVLTVFAVYKKVPLYGFYSMPTCISVLLMAVVSFAGLALNMALNVHSLIFGFGLAAALICCYGVKSRYPFKIKQTVCKL